ncbi:hypothetical protein HDZ31DRAFT_29064 [Schizophyllum fasciatum]
MESQYFTQTKRSASELSSRFSETESAKKRKTSNSCDLGALLDCSQLLTESAIMARFDDIASALLYSHELVVCSDTVEHRFRLLEFEFYLHKPGCHEDPFVHRTAEQGELGRWYFHRAPGKGTTKYRGGTRKGLDLTFGDAQAYGGVLLRAAQRVDSSEVVCGPSLLVDKVVSLSGASDLVDLVDNRWAGDTSAFTPGVLYLRRREDAEGAVSHQLHRTPRVGLDMSSASRGAYVAKLYRYVASFDSPLKSKAQTFVGAILHCCPAKDEDDASSAAPDVAKRLHDPRLSERLATITALSTAVAGRYLKDYRVGFDKRSIDSFVGMKNVSSSPSSYLPMMGALHRSRT